MVIFIKDDNSYMDKEQKKISAGKFKATCLSVLDEVHDDGATYVVTKYGKPVAKIVPLEVQEFIAAGEFKDKARIIGDVISPLGEDVWGDLEK